VSRLLTIVDSIPAFVPLVVSVDHTPLLVVSFNLRRIWEVAAAIVGVRLGTCLPLDLYLSSRNERRGDNEVVD